MPDLKGNLERPVRLNKQMKCKAIDEDEGFHVI